MKKLFVLLLNLVCLLPAQNVGTVTFTPPAAGKVTMVAGNLSCELTGNAVPATIINVNCMIGSFNVNYNIPISEGNSYTGSHSLNGNSVTFIFNRPPGELIQWQASATPFQGQTASGSGNF